MGNKESYMALQAAVLSKDFDGVRKHIADDFVMYEPEALPYGGAHHGPEGFVNLTKVLREYYSVELIKSEITEAGDELLVCEFTFGFTSERTGQYQEERVVDLFRFGSDGKIVRADIYYTDPVKLASIA